MGGKQRKRIFPLADKELLRLSKEDSGILLRKNVHQTAYVTYDNLPTTSPQFKQAVSEDLNKRILKHNRETDDVVLRYFNIRIVYPVDADLCRKICVQCIADMFVFKPEYQKIMTATVNKKSKNHVGCIMHNVFNVSIVRPNDVPYHRWVGRDVNINDEVNFKVQKVDVAEVIPYIIGELVMECNDEGSCVLIEECGSVVSLSSEDPSVE